MKINRLCNLLRIIFNTFAIIVILFITLGLVLDFFINNGNSFKVHIYFLIITLLAKVMFECFIVVLNKYSVSSMFFCKSYFVYKSHKYYICDVSFRYFKFQWTFLESDLVIPKLVISISSGEKLICYITKKQLKKLKSEMAYDIKEI